MTGRDRDPDWEKEAEYEKTADWIWAGDSWWEQYDSCMDRGVEYRDGVEVEEPDEPAWHVEISDPPDFEFDALCREVEAQPGAKERIDSEVARMNENLELPVVYVDFHFTPDGPVLAHAHNVVDGVVLSVGDRATATDGEAVAPAVVVAVDGDHLDLDVDWDATVDHEPDPRTQNRRLSQMTPETAEASRARRAEFRESRPVRVGDRVRVTVEPFAGTVGTVVASYGPSPDSGVEIRVEDHGSVSDLVFLRREVVRLPTS